jgi:hypothetical protein
MFAGHPAPLRRAGEPCCSAACRHTTIQPSRSDGKMKIRPMLALALCVVAVLPVPCLAQGVVVAVRSTTGQPLAGVTVEIAFPHEYIKTNDDGEFALPSPQGRYTVIYIRHPHYRPVARVIYAGTRSTEVVLEPEEASEWNVPICDGAPLRSRRLDPTEDGYVTFVAPNGTKYKRGDYDIDCKVDGVSYGSGRNRRWLEFWVGPGAIGVFPTADIIARSSEFTIRSWGIGGSKAGRIDARGRWTNGRRWRHVCFGWGVGAAIYTDVSDEAAAFFDTIIDSMCVSERQARPASEDLK